MQLKDRQESLLVSIINNYIQAGVPVSSKLMEKTGFFGLSSATIRAEMNDLEELGYLVHLHTSGGRIPTDRAYRYFVNSLLESGDYNIQPTDRRKIKTTLADVEHDPREINKTIANLISHLSDNMVITGIEEQDEFYKTGISTLMDFPEFREIDRVLQLTSFFDEFESMFSMIQREFARAVNHPPAGGEQEFSVFIGVENSIKNVRQESVIMARYNLPHNCIGSMTIVGPTRMDYKKNLGLVKYATEELNKIAKIT